MTDNMTLEQRSKTMSNIRSKWTKPEKIVHSYLKSKKIKHVMHPKALGSPDIIIDNAKIAIFVHGCFWHKCPKCYKEPKTRKEYWLPKIAKNVERDKANKKILKGKGFRILVIWEHQLKHDAWQNKLL